MIVACTGYNVSLYTDWTGVFDVVNFVTYNLTLNTLGTHSLGVKVQNVFGVLYDNATMFNVDYYYYYTF